MGIRKHKFNAKKQKTEDGKFDSKKELKVWEELKLLQQCGEISELTRVRKDCTFDLHGLDGSLVCRYIGDYKFVEQGKKVVGDTKGMRTGEYKIKRKLFMAEYGEEFEHREY